MVRPAVFDEYEKEGKYRALLFTRVIWITEYVIKCINIRSGGRSVQLS